MVKTICYNTTRNWENREQALAYFERLVRTSKGCEKERYTEVYMQLKDGHNVCSDFKIGRPL